MQSVITFVPPVFDDRHAPFSFNATHCPSVTSTQHGHVSCWRCFRAPFAHFTCNACSWVGNKWSYKRLISFHHHVTEICGSEELSRYSDPLQARRYGVRIPVETRFSAPVQTGPGVHPASYTIGTGSFPRLKRPGRRVDHPPISGAEVKERVELYLHFTSGPSWPVVGWNLPLSLPFTTEIYTAKNVNLTLQSLVVIIHTAMFNNKNSASCHTLRVFHMIRPVKY